MHTNTLHQRTTPPAALYTFDDPIFLVPDKTHDLVAYRRVLYFLIDDLKGIRHVMTAHKNKAVDIFNLADHVFVETAASEADRVYPDELQWFSCAPYKRRYTFADLRKASHKAMGSNRNELLGATHAFDNSKVFDGDMS